MHTMAYRSIWLEKDIFGEHLDSYLIRSSPIIENLAFTGHYSYDVYRLAR